MNLKLPRAGSAFWFVTITLPAFCILKPLLFSLAKMDCVFVPPSLICDFYIFPRLQCFKYFIGVNWPFWFLYLNAVCLHDLYGIEYKYSMFTIKCNWSFKYH
ncbi:hypothetical protein V8G54_010733 [Vigna mungo]|uniref:Uncharacterized protein n=1 Tax=Vigna mungo TaxID=3915 RepID=A0AAQ3NZ23_VIGMU